MTDQNEGAGTAGAGTDAQAGQPEPQGSPVGQPAGGQGDLSAEVERGDRASANPEQDTGEDSSQPFYTT